MTETPAAPVRIVLADDHAAIRAGLRILLEHEADLEIVGEAGDGPSTASMVGRRKPDVLVLDLNMPGLKPLEDVPRLLADLPGLRIVILTMVNDPLTARELIRVGASGYVLKNSADSELVEAIHAAAAGRRFVNPELGAELAVVDLDPLAQLDERDKELLRLAALGYTNREIGERLYLSVRAIEVNRSQLQERLGIKSRPELLRFALEHGLVEQREGS